MIETECSVIVGKGLVEGDYFLGPDSLRGLFHICMYLLEKLPVCTGYVLYKLKPKSLPCCWCCPKLCAYRLRVPAQKRTAAVLAYKKSFAGSIQNVRINCGQKDFRLICSKWKLRKSTDLWNNLESIFDFLYNWSTEIS